MKFFEKPFAIQQKANKIVNSKGILKDPRERSKTILKFISIYEEEKILLR